MLEDCNYNKVRLLHDLSRISWYLDRHAKKDAKEGGHELCHEMCHELQQDLEKHIEKLKQAVVGLAKEDKFN
ncbi:MAG: hypothetical protein R6U32_07840 [Candidatus Woesearchaeota archaeon]